LPSANRNLVHFKWTPRTALSCDTCEMPFARPLQGITYQLVAMDMNDCVGRDTIRIRVPNHEIIFIPNSFSPNGDGKNDIFFINTYNQEVRLIKKCSIFNRWGDRIFDVSNVEPNDPSKGWDGNFNGQPLSAGIYLYIIEFEFVNGATTVKTGDINLMR
jgi:gliding motility-associated-like protein